MLTENDRSRIKTLMEEQIAELEKSIPELRERSAPVSPDQAIGRLSRTDSMMNAGTVGLALKEARARLNRLRNRIDRVEDPEFDQCALCGEEIPLERLLVAPDRGVCPRCLSNLQRK